MADGPFSDIESKRDGNCKQSPHPSHLPPESDEPLLDITDSGVDEEALILAGDLRGQAVGLAEEVEAVRFPAQGGSKTTGGDRLKQDPATQGLNHPNIPKPSQDSSIVRPQYSGPARKNPFDFPYQEHFNPRQSKEANEAYYDQYDQLNFGDPTFVSSYRSSQLARSSNTQNQPQILGSAVQSGGRQTDLGKPHSSLPRHPLPDVTGHSAAANSELFSSPAYTVFHSAPVSETNSVRGISSPGLAPHLGRDSYSSVDGVAVTSDTLVSASDSSRREIDAKRQNNLCFSPDLIIHDFTLAPSTRGNDNSRKSAFSNPPQRLPPNEKTQGMALPFQDKNMSQDSDRANTYGNQSRSGQNDGFPQALSNSGFVKGDHPEFDNYRSEEANLMKGPNRDNYSFQLGPGVDSSEPTLSFAPQKMEDKDHTLGASRWEEAEDEVMETAPLLVDTTSDAQVFAGRKGVASGGFLQARTDAPSAIKSRSLAARPHDGKNPISANNLGSVTERSFNDRDRFSQPYTDCPNDDENDIINREQSGLRERNMENRAQVWYRNAYGEFSGPHAGADGAASGGNPAFSYQTTFRHCHKQKVMSLQDKVALRQLLTVVILCVLFMIGETVGGVLANSLALFTDVLHLGSDLVSFVISLLAMWLANKPATKKMSFGYHRAEVLGALFSVFLIWLVSGVLCYIAVERIMHEHYKDVKPDEMLITASLGVVFNLVMAFVLHSERCCSRAHSHNKFGHGHSHGGHGHGHGHSHSHNKDDLLDVAPGRQEWEDDQINTRPADFRYQSLEESNSFEASGEQLRNIASDSRDVSNVEAEISDEEALHRHKNINVRAAFIHVVGDIIQSLGVLVAALIIKFTTDEKFKLADPICTFLFSLLVLITTIAVLRDTLLVIMEAVPRDLSFESLKRELAALDGVVTVHSLHIWALTLDRNALSVHLAIENPRIHDQVLSTATKLLQDRHHFFHSTIQVEIYDEVAMRDCRECKAFN